MAPVPEERPHYNGASPLDGGSDPVSLGGGDSKFSPSGLEIGLIVGIVALAIVSLIWLFFWRSRRNRAARQARAPSTTTRRHDEEFIDTSGLRIPTPISKDDRASTGDKDEVSSIERPPCSYRRPTMNWSHWAQSPRPNHAEEHELPTRV